MPIPLFNCSIDPIGMSSVAQLFASGQLAAGEHVPALEAEISARVGNRPVVVLSDMTQALQLALQLSGVSKEDGSEVLTLSYNCMSSNSAIHHAGGTPVWLDIDPETATIDMHQLRSRISRKCRALVAYHVAGYPADAAALKQLCDDAGIALIEDANNAFGAILPDGQVAGSYGRFSVFSFYANRNINGIEGAALVCPNEETAEVVRRLRRFGIDQRAFRDSLGEIDREADIPEIGVSASLSNVNAAVARHSLSLLDERLELTRHNARTIASKLKGIPGLVPVKSLGEAVPCHWALLLLSERRDDLLRALKQAGIGCSKLHQPNHVYSGYRSGSVALPATDRFMDQIIAVPCGWWVGDDDCDGMSALIRAVHS